MMMPTLSELAERYGLELVGEGSARIEGICPLVPGKPGYLSFLANPQYSAQLAETRAAGVIVSKRDVVALKTPALVAPDPYLAYARIARLFDHSRLFTAGVAASAVVDASAELAVGVFIGANAVIGAGVCLGEGSYIGPGCVVGAGAVIGAGSRLEAAVTVVGGARLGARVLVQPGAVIGSRGFGNARLPDGSWEEVPQLGGVVIGDDVEIGANTTIDRGALGDTVIENGVKLDNQIQIAHNCHIGEHTAIAGCAGIAGSTTVGKRCMIGGAANLNGHIRIADDVVILGRAMVSGNLTKAGVYGSGLTAQPVREWRRTVARVRRLDRVDARIKALERALKIESEAEPQQGDS